MPFGVDVWSDRIASCETEGARRRLMAEVGLWRAGRLTDIMATRQATFALSRLHAVLQEHDAAVREARALLSLCQTPPRATDDDIEAAKGWLNGLGERVPKIVDAKPARGRRDAKPRRERTGGKKAESRPDRGPTALERAVAAGQAGAFGDGLKALRGKRGPKADLARTWLQLSRALAQDDPARARDDLENLQARLQSKLVEPASAGSKPEASTPRPEAKEANAPQAKREGPSPRALARQRAEALTAALSTEEPPTVDALLPLLQGWERLWRAIAAAERVPLDEVRVERLLRAVDQAADSARPIPGGTSLAVKVASTGSDRVKEVLTTEPTAARYGGVGVADLVDVTSAAVSAGWGVDRVLKGPTRRERRAHAVLETVEDAMGGLWRVLLKRGEARRELWYIAALPPEGRAGVPVLLLEDHKRVVVVPSDGDLGAWFDGLDAVDAIRWAPERAEAVSEALDAG